MTDLLVFGGTTEGRELAEWASAGGVFETAVCCATEYGGSLVEGLPRVTPLAGRLDAAGMAALMASRPFACVVDCTHPYAVEVSRNVRAACGRAGLPYLRVAREDGGTGPWLRAASPEEAARIVAGMPGRVLLTTGTKDLPLYMAAVPDAARRLFARVLPVPESLELARRAGLPDGHVVAAKGPFSLEENVRLIERLGVSVLVTKASGTAGGFMEKVEAARLTGCTAVVVERPFEERGLTLAEAERRLGEIAGI